MSTEKNVVIKFRKKPTPIRTALLWVSLTTNVGMAVFAWAITTGNLSRTYPVPTTSELAQQIESDSITNLPTKPVHLSKR